jgi:hypothetical protein
MTDEELKSFYEKLYFQEVEARDKVNARLQMPLTLILATLGAVAFLLDNFDHQLGTWTASRMAFTFFFATGSIVLVLAMIRFAGALYNHEYHFLPDSLRTAEYRALLEQTYKEFAERERLISEAMNRYIEDAYIQYAAFNTRVNDRRSAYIHLCNGAIIASAALFIAAFVTFHFGDLNKSRIKVATEVVVAKPVEVRIQDSRKQP